MRSQPHPGRVEHTPCWVGPGATKEDDEMPETSVDVHQGLPHA